MQQRSNIPPGAEQRLFDMLTHKVDLVDLAANLKRWLLVKNAKGTPLALPSEARTALIEGIDDALEALVAVTQALKESTVDDGAKVPDELLRAVFGVGQRLVKLPALATAAADQPDTTDAEKSTAKGAEAEWPHDLSAVEARRAPATVVDAALADLRKAFED